VIFFEQRFAAYLTWGKGIIHCSDKLDSTAMFQNNYSIKSLSRALVQHFAALINHYEAQFYISHYKAQDSVQLEHLFFPSLASSTNKIVPLATIIVVTSLISLYYYLNISYSRFIILNTEIKWNLKSDKNETTKSITALILSSVSLTGITVCTIITDIN